MHQGGVGWGGARGGGGRRGGGAHGRSLSVERESNCAKQASKTCTPTSSLCASYLLQHSPWLAFPQPWPPGAPLGWYGSWLIDGRTWQAAVWLLAAGYWQHCKELKQGVAGISMHQSEQETCTMFQGMQANKAKDVMQSSVQEGSQAEEAVQGLASRLWAMNLSFSRIPSPPPPPPPSYWLSPTGSLG